jgi:hypothetical protein
MMITEFTRNASSLEDALYALAVAKPVPDAAVLDDVVRQYPEHAARLTDMAVALALEAIADQIEEPVLPEVAAQSDAVVSAMSRFHNRLYEVRASEQAAPAKAATVPANPFASLNTIALRNFGTSIGANTVFAIKLRDRIIELETMTKGFQQHVADRARVPLDMIVAHLAGPSEMPIAVHYKANEKPVVGKKQTFEEGVRSSGLTPEQQKFLLGL